MNGLSDHTQSGLPENIAALLSYVLGWITGLVFLLTDKRPYVRFHAAQSIVVFLGLHILRVVLGMACASNYRWREALPRASRAGRREFRSRNAPNTWSRRGKDADPNIPI